MSTREPAPRRDDLEDTVIAAWGDTVLRPRGATGGPSTSTTVVPPRIAAVRIGERIERLDVPVIVGRRPSAPRLVSGPAPRLVVVPSPAQEVSSSHVEIRQDGDVVVVTDLRSTNGTVVRLPTRTRETPARRVDRGAPRRDSGPR